jgi:hypothetical protein
MSGVTCQSDQASTGLRCTARAAWIVQVGTRKTDEQAACGNHLSRVCLAMDRGEGERRNVTLTVRRVQ